MRASSIIMLAVAFVLAGASAFLAKIWLEGQVPEQQVVIAKPDVETDTVVVATRPLRFGTELSTSYLQQVEWPKGAIPKGAFQDIEEIMGSGKKRIVLSAIAANEPVLKSKITGPGQRATLSALVDDEMKAVAIRVNDVLGVAGFVLPGERVDVLLTQVENREVEGGPSQKKAFADVLLQNVRVLAVDQEADDQTSKPSLVKTVTIEVNTEQAQKLALGSVVGQLSLALRSAGTTNVAHARRISLSDLRSGAGSVALAAAAGAGPADRTSAMVAVTRALERMEYSVPHFEAAR